MKEILLLNRRAFVATSSVLSVVLAGGCSRKSRDPSSAPLKARGEYRGPLVDPAEIPGDFLWEQRVSASHGQNKGAFDAVLQKRGAELLILGLTPMKTRGFTITQRGTDFEYKQFVPFELPFSPASVLYDVHRCFFFELLDGFPTSGSRKSTLEREVLTDDFMGGRLQRRTFENVADSGEQLTVRYGPPGYALGAPPRTVTLVNAAYGYQLTVTTTAVHQL
jgi:hypothetical protein